MAGPPGRSGTVAVLLHSHDYLEEAPRLVEEGRVDGFIIRNMDEPDAHRRLVGKLAGRDVPFILVGNPLGDCQSITIDNVGGDFSTPSGFNAMRSSFERGRHDAVFAANDRMALGVTAMETLARLLVGAPAHSRHVIPHDHAGRARLLRVPLRRAQPDQLIRPSHSRCHAGDAHKIVALGEVDVGDVLVYRTYLDVGRRERSQDVQCQCGEPEAIGRFPSEFTTG
jgi:hypothetical protein